MLTLEDIAAMQVGPTKWAKEIISGIVAHDSNYIVFADAEQRSKTEERLAEYLEERIHPLLAHVDELERYMSQLESALFDVQVHLTQTKVADPIIKTGLDVFQGLISSCYRATSILRRNSP